MRVCREEREMEQIRSGRRREPAEWQIKLFGGPWTPNDLSLPPEMSGLASANFVGYVNYGATSWQLVTPIKRLSKCRMSC